MAKGISYLIKGKYDSSGEKAASKGLSSITKAAKTFNLCVAGFVAKKVFEGINKVISGSTEAFTAQNKALTNFNKSIANNSKMTEGAFDRLHSKMAELQADNFIDADAINNAAALASNMGLAENQITDVMDAATNLYASGLMPLDAATKALSLSYGGNVAQLKKMCPELESLTDEELANGKAIDILNEKYAGYRDTMADTFSGRDTQFKNNFADLQASIGGVFQSIKFVAQGFLAEPMQKLTSYIEENRNKIINFAIHLPEIISVVFNSIKEIINQTFSDTGIKDLGSFVFDSFKNWTPAIIQLIKTVIEAAVNFLDLTFGNIGRLIYNKIIIPIKSWLQDLINGLIEKISGSKLATALGLDDNISKLKLNFDLSPTTYSTITDFKQGIKENLDGIKEETKKSFENQKSTNADFAKKYSSITNEMSENLSGILNQDLPKDLQTAFAAGVTTLPATASENDSENLTESAKTFSEIIGSLGETGTLISKIFDAITSGTSPLGIVLSLISDLVKTLTDEIPALTDFTNLVSTFMAELASVLAPVLTPLINVLMNLLNSVLASIIQMLIPVLEVLTPIIKFIADTIAWLYNTILVPIINTLVYMFTGVYNTFMAIWNGIATCLNAIQIPTSAYWDWGLHVSWSSLGSLMGIQKGSYKNAADYTAKTISTEYESSSATTDSSDTTASTSTGASANYTATGDTYVNIYYNNSFVNGDAEEIALQIRNEILAAERKGY